MNAPQHFTINQREVPEALIASLKSRFAERCSTAMAVREQHGRDESAFHHCAPARCFALRGLCYHRTVAAPPDMNRGLVTVLIRNC